MHSETQIQQPVESGTNATVTDASANSPSFNVGNKVQLLLGGGGRPDAPLSTTLIGYVDKQFVLLKLPVAANGVPITFYEGDHVSVRIFTGVSVYVFNAKALRCELHPFYCLFLSYPAEVRTLALRNSLRVRADLPCVIKTGGKEESGTLVNLSTSGALIQCLAKGNAVGDRVNISFSLQSQSGSAPNQLDLQADVRSATEVMVKGTEFAQYGVQFAELNAMDQLALQNHAYEVLLSDRKRIV
jgi:c-di-GMP-binding flagellar brake protein YcgR